MTKVQAPEETEPRYNLDEHVNVYTLTPEFAAELLATNDMNRKVREEWVDYLASEMSEGRWQVNGDAIRIDRDGKLADGQHRCLAVIKANYSYPAIFVSELDPIARLTMDDPMHRRFADDLVMNGMGPNANLREACLRKILTWEDVHGFATKRERVGRARLAEEYPRYRKQIDKAIEVAFAHRKSPLGESVGTFIAWLLLREAPREVVEKYFSILAIGSQSEQDATLVQARDKMLTMKNDPLINSRGNPTPIIIWLAIRGWNNWLTGKTTGYQLPRGRKLENPFPLPARLERG